MNRKIKYRLCVRALTLVKMSECLNFFHCNCLLLIINTDQK